LDRRPVHSHIVSRDSESREKGSRYCCEGAQKGQTWRKKNEKIENFFLWCSADAPEDEAICLFAGLLANPDVPLSPRQKNEGKNNFSFQGKNEGKNNLVLEEKKGENPHLNFAQAELLILQKNGQFPDEPV
jgi:hypothetical protein